MRSCPSNGRSVMTTVCTVADRLRAGRVAPHRPARAHLALRFETATRQEHRPAPRAPSSRVAAARRSFDRGPGGTIARSHVSPVHEFAGRGRERVTRKRGRSPYPRSVTRLVNAPEQHRGNGCGECLAALMLLVIGLSRPPPRRGATYHTASQSRQMTRGHHVCSWRDETLPPIVQAPRGAGETAPPAFSNAQRTQAGAGGGQELRANRRLCH
jgi:hypothetical protein